MQQSAWVQSWVCVMVLMADLKGSRPARWGHVDEILQASNHDWINWDYSIEKLERFWRSWGYLWLCVISKSEFYYYKSAVKMMHNYSTVGAMLHSEVIEYLSVLDEKKLHDTFILHHERFASCKEQEALQLAIQKATGVLYPIRGDIAPYLPLLAPRLIEEAQSAPHSKKLRL